MVQPKRGTKKIKTNNKPVSFGTGYGLDYCNECPFLDIQKGYCNTSDKELKFDNKDKIIVPDWCGNKKIISNE